MAILLGAIFGLVVGSFLNVVVLRLGTGRSLIGGRSSCMSCGHKLETKDLVPVFSFLFQKGKCRYCKSPISIQYVLVELTTAVAFSLLASRNSSLLLYVIVAILIAIAVYDLRHKIIPDTLVYLFIALAFIAHGPGLWAGPMLFAAFALLWLLSGGRWMGFGDAKLVLGIGLLLGAPLALGAVLIAFWIGAFFGLALLYLRRGEVTMKSEIPFAPFLILATLMQLFLPIYLPIWSR